MRTGGVGTAHVWFDQVRKGWAEGGCVVGSGVSKALHAEYLWARRLLPPLNAFCRALGVQQHALDGGPTLTIQMLSKHGLCALIWHIAWNCNAIEGNVWGRRAPPFIVGVVLFQASRAKASLRSIRAKASTMAGRCSTILAKLDKLCWAFSWS